MRILGCLVLLLAGLWSASPALAQPSDRIGLFIGNANYPDASTPLTTIKDARALAGELRRFSFVTEIKENAGKDEMQRSVDAFLAKITKGSIAVFYFGGYGLQVARQNYLVPINAEIWNESDIKRDGISIDWIVGEMDRKGAAVKIIIVDAAYRNPYERRFRSVPSGLVALDSPTGTLVIYSTALGRVTNTAGGDNSLLVSELIKELRAPSRSVELIFNDTRRGVSRVSNNEQVPWVASSLVVEFSLTITTRTAATPPADPAPKPDPVPTPQPAVPSPDPTPKPALAPALPPAPLPPVAQIGPTPAISIKAIFEKHNLIGTFAWDCSKPASRNNWYFVNRVVDENHVQRDLMEGGTSRTWLVTLDRAWEQGANEIGMSGTRGGAPVTGVWRIDGRSMVQWDATRSGQQEIKDGKAVNSGVAMPRLHKCDGTAAREPGIDRPGSDYRTIERLTPEGCLSACKAEARCRAYTHVAAGFQAPYERCWLKLEVPPSRPHPCCTSGVVR